MKKILCALTCFGFFACSNPELEAKYAVEIGKKYPLKEWPDAFIMKNLDSLLNSELVFKKKKVDPVSLALKTTNEKFAPSDFQPGKKETQAGDDIPRPKILSAEEKMERFLAVLDEWGQDPQNRKFFREVRTRKGQDSMEALLKANYGSWTGMLPMGILEYQLRALNNGADFATLPEGTLVRLPKL